MARTGSGKTLAYMIPLLQRLGGIHSTTFGARAIVLVPARELALQVLKVGKELARGWGGGAGAHAGDNEVDVQKESKQALRWGLIVGGENLDEQFEVITSNPDVYVDIIIHLLQA
jgi:ATP-dependent RNA helicase DDX54/DBP10